MSKLYDYIYDRVYRFFFHVVVHAMQSLKLDRIVREEFVRDAHNLSKGMQLRALSSSVDYAEAHFSGVPSFADNESLWAYCLKQVPKRDDGLFIECGVWEGRSINFFAENINGIIYGFDSFQGLPERWYGEFDREYFKVDRLPAVRDNVRLLKGWFEETLPVFIQSHSGPVVFLHVDCDLYSSTKSVLRHLGARIIPGTVIVFDEWYNYPGWQEGEYKAFREFVSEQGATYRFVGYNRHHSQVAVQIEGIRGEKN